MVSVIGERGRIVAFIIRIFEFYGKVEGVERLPGNSWTIEHGRFNI
jgi:hypothetical protein